jgi:hypothetical protein
LNDSVSARHCLVTSLLKRPECVARVYVHDREIQSARKLHILVLGLFR